MTWRALFLSCLLAFPTAAALSATAARADELRVEAVPLQAYAHPPGQPDRPGVLVIFLVVTVTDAMGRPVPAFENRDAPPSPVTAGAPTASLKVTMVGCNAPPAGLACPNEGYHTSFGKGPPGVYFVQVSQNLFAGAAVHSGILVEASLATMGPPLIGQPADRKVIGGRKLVLVRPNITVTP